MKLRLPWQKKPVAEPVEAVTGLTITDGTYGRLDHVLNHDPDGYGFLGKSLEEIHEIFHKQVSPRERYGFDHDLTLDDLRHAMSGEYKRGDHG
jgi:hypothetical protein